MTTSQEDTKPQGKFEPDIQTMEAVLVGESAPEILALEAQLRAAQLGADVAALERLISDDLLFTGQTGQLGTKAQDLEAHGSGFLRFRGHEPEELRVRSLGEDVAVSALRARLAVEVAGTLIEGRIVTLVSGRAKKMESGVWLQAT